MTKAETTVKINGGMMGFGVGRAEFVVETDIKFEEGFCSLHPNALIAHEEIYDNYAPEKKEENWYCKQCRKWDEVRFAALLKKAKIDCADNVEHSHECRCWVGHDCDMDSCAIQDELKRRAVDEAGNPCEPNAMEVLGAEAPNRAMLGVTQRIAHLENENEALKTVVQKLVGLLSEDTREALGCTEILLGTCSPASD